MPLRKRPTDRPSERALFSRRGAAGKGGARALRSAEKTDPSHGFSSDGADYVRLVSLEIHPAPLFFDLLSPDLMQRVLVFRFLPAGALRKFDHSVDCVN